MMTAFPRRPGRALRAVALVSALLTAAPATAAVSGAASAAVTPTRGEGQQRTLLVLAKEGVGDASARAAIAAAGGSVTAANTAVGLYTVTAPSASAATLRAADVVSGVAADQVIGRSPHDLMTRAEAVEKALADRQSAGLAVTAKGAARGARKPSPPAAGDPLSPLQWDMRMIRAGQAQRHTTGRGVRVGVMDTGVDASHPDIAAHFNARLSRNFTVDIPAIDGPCAQDPDGSCADPADVDEDGHGTHVAGTIASPRNGRGIVGVAPNAEIVNLRAGQDSGFFFLAPTVNALTYAGDHGIDVVNMSFYIDPWLFNCAANPADTPEQQAEQRTIIAATNRALRYARHRGVTLISAAGNEHTDLDNPTVDDTSPDYPPSSAHPRTVDDSCLSMPAEGDGVLAVSSVGPSTLKADYSNWGARAVAVAAPGGSYRDGFGTPTYRTPQNLILAPMPKALALASGSIDPATGASTDPFIVSECPAGKGSCAYYQYLQGTSMAAPHAAGVAALIVAQYGRRDRRGGGLTLSPKVTEKVLLASAADTACPAPVYTYPDRPPSYAAACAGSTARNSWYGEGIVDAYAAVSRRPRS